MKSRLIILLFTLFGIVNTFAQTTVNVEGTVLNENSEPIENAVVKLLNSHFLTSTNEEGKFHFANVASGTYIFNITHPGFSEINKEIQIGNEKVQYQFNLSPVLLKLDEVIINAPKREELLQKTALSITSLSSREIEDAQIWRSADLAAVAPNLNLNNPGDGRNVISIRGIATTSYDPAIATYIDGVNQFNLDTYIPQLFDVEQIEILRGPQGTLYGRNAMGGVINITTKQPGNKPSVFAEASFGNYSQQRYLAGLRTPLIKDKLFFGTAALFQKREGFYTNEFNNSSYDAQRSFSGNYYLKYLINPNWKLNLNVKHVSNRNHGPFPLVMGIAEAFANPFRLNQNAITEMVDNIFNSSLSVDYKGRNLNFTSQSSYQSNYRYYKDAIDGDFSPLDAVSIYNNYGKSWNNVKVATQEFRFSSPARIDNPLKWTAGSYIFYGENPVKQATQFGEDAALMGMEPNFSLINSTQTTTSGIAFFGQGTYNITKDLEITTGIRYDHEHKKQSVRGEYVMNPEPAFEFRSDTTATANFSAFSPKFGLNYHITEDRIIFLIYGKGFRAGGLTPLSADPSQPPLYQYKPETSNNFEIGTKNYFLHKRLILNATIFYTTVTDVQVPTLIMPEAVTIIRNTGKLTSKGVELEMKAFLIKGLEFDYNFGVTDAIYKSLKISSDSGEMDLKGKKQIFTPDFTSLLAAQFNSALNKNGNLRITARGEWKIFGKQYFDLTNTMKQPSYALLNGHLGLIYNEFEFTIWSRNLLDKKYIAYSYDFGAVHLGAPRTFGCTLSVKI